MKKLDLPPSSTKELVNQQIKASLYTYFGDSLFRLKYFKRAQRAYEQALAFNDAGYRRASKRFKTGPSHNSNCDITKIGSNSININESELKHRIHLCHLELHDLKEAKAVLERIPLVERTNKILASLADLYYMEKNVELARQTYFELLRQDPLRLDIIIKLCKLGGCNASTILQLIPDNVKKDSWYPTWVQAQCHLHSPNSKQAIRLFEVLTSRFERTAPILTSLAEAHYHDGNYKEAIRIFQIAYNSDPESLAGIDSYAACLHKESSKRALEDLAIAMGPKCNVEGEYFHEPWLVLAHYFASNDKREPKALLFVQKAYKLNRHSVEALILLASLCLEKKDPAKAIPYVLTAQLQAPYRYEVQRILCDTFLANNKKAAAVNYASAAAKSLGETSRAFYLYADVMLKLQNQRRRSLARDYLERAVKLDKDFLPAVFAFTEMLLDERKYDVAIGILTTALPSQSCNKRLHTYLRVCYNELGDYDKAIYHQNLSSDDCSLVKVNDEHLHRSSQDQTASQDETDQQLGLEADELVDELRGESEDEVNATF